MSIITRTSLALVVAFAAGCASSGGSAAPEREPTQEEETAAWMAVANPGPEHARMAAEAGTWTVAGKMWMDPSAPPEESTGTAVIRMIHDGRFQVMEYESTMMGMPFRGMGISGFDNFTKKYVNSWCDSMGTMMMFSEGTVDPATDSLTLTSEWLDPLGRKVRSRQVSKRRDADHMDWAMYGATGSKPECLVMELRFTRKR